MSAARKEIEQVIMKNPGLSFSHLKQKTGLSNGEIQYHLRKSEKIEVEKGGVIRKGFCDECSLSRFCSDKCVLKELRKERTSDIMKLLGKDLSQSRIADELGIDRSTVHYHVDKLRDLGLVEGSNPVLDPENV